MKDKKIQAQYSMLSYMIDLYFHYCNLTIEIVENDNCDIFFYETERQKAIEDLFVRLSELMKIEKRFSDVFKKIFLKLFRHNLIPHV